MLGVLLWLSGAERLLSVFPGLPPMMPNSALAALLLGLAGAVVLRRRSSRTTRYLVIIATSLVIIVSAVTVAEYALGIRFLLDELVQKQKDAVLSSPPSALAFSLLGFAILLFRRRFGSSFRPAEWLILASGLIAVTALLGYLYGASSAYRVTGAAPPGITFTSGRVIRVAGDLLIVGISFLTALSLLLVSIGLYLGRSDWQTMSIIAKPGPGRVIVKRLMPVAVLVPIGFGVLASRFPNAENNPLVLAGLTDGTGMLGLLLLGITGRKLNRGNEAIASARKRACEILELASDGILITDAAGRLVDVNEAACRLVAYTRKELLGKIITEFMPANDAERFSARTQQLLYGQTDVSEWNLARRDGLVFPVEISATVLPDMRWLGIVRDITARKQMEEALRLSDATARQAVKVRDDLLGVVAHDLRSPLHVVSIDADTLNSSHDARTQEIGNEISKAAKRMERLIQDLLDVTRIGAGLFTVRRVRVPVSELIRDILPTEKVLISSAQLELRVVVSADIPDVWGDQDRLAQVFDNLISNAIRSTGAGGTITVTAEKGMQEVIFSVSDTGKGIPETDLPHIFDRFWRLHEEERRSVGLGLAIVKGIIDAHNGRIWVESRVGHGTRFSFAIPQAPQNTRRSHGQIHPEAKVSSNSKKTPGEPARTRLDLSE